MGWDRCGAVKGLKNISEETQIKHVFYSVGMGWEICDAMKGVKNLSEET